MINSKTENTGFFNEERVKRLIIALGIIFLIKGMYYTSTGLISELTHSNVVDGVIRLSENISSVGSSTYSGSQGTDWFNSFSILETIECGFYLYCVFVGFVYDLLYSRFPRVLPLILGILFALFSSIRFFEILGENLVWLLLYGIILVAISIYLGIAILGNAVLMVYYIVFDIGGIVASTIGLLTPIFIALIFLVSLIEFIFA